MHRRPHAVLAPFRAVIPHFRAGHLRVTQPSATRLLEQARATPFDLHVSRTPPAFVLSQDQTLRTKQNSGLARGLHHRSSSDLVPLTRVGSCHSSAVKVTPPTRRHSFD